MGDLPTIGASELAVTVGLQRRHADGTPWTSALELYARLRGLLPRYDEDGGPDAEAGMIAEPGIGFAYAKRHGLAFGADMVPGPQMPDPGLSHPDLPWLRVRPDFLVVTGKRVVQAKAPREITDEWGHAGTGDVPVWVAVQELAELAVVYRLYGWVRADVAVHARAARRGERVSAEFTLMRDETLEARVLRRARDWYERHVVDGTPPAPDGSPSAGSALARIFRPADRVLEATDDEVRRWSHALQLQSMRDELEAKLAEEKQQLQARMKDATLLTRNGQTLATWRARAGAERIDSKRLRRELPDVAARFTTVGEPGRRFLLEGRGED